MAEWRKVPGYPNYQISIDTKEGRCRSLNYKHTGNVKELSNRPDKRENRICWNLCKDGKSTNQQAARWIALTYPELIEGEYFEGAVIDHINTDAMDNRPENLRWVTLADNNRNPLTRKHLTNNPYKSKQVYQYDKQGVLISTYPSLAEAQRQTRIDKGHISSCCNGKRKSTGGYIWRYE